MIPGQFTGSTGLTAMSKSELNKGKQPWANTVCVLEVFKISFHLLRSEYEFLPQKGHFILHRLPNIAGSCSDNC